MTDEWFHKRRPDEGTGYSVKSRKGLIAAIVFVVLVTAVAITAVNVSLYRHTPPFATLLVAMGVVIVLIIAFVAFVMARSDTR